MSGLDNILGNERHLLQQMLGEEEATWREHTGSMIGRYELTKKLGEGGFGVVWKARQTEPVRRQVALKLIKVGMDTLQVLTRFDLERQVLASMEHPHIASLLDAGATNDGRPYFVMELVSGEPIQQFCAKKKLSLHERLDLFQKVCHAVQHAHQKGIIHRDLKPSNILVMEDKSGYQPKIIDFGIAKAITQEQFMDVTLMTRQDVLIGTPLYMSPEQLEGSADVDTRSDIYSLGVLLYELLTGEQPYDTETYSGAALLRLLKEDTPSRPSTRITAKLKKGSEADSKLRLQSDSIPVDLDWVTMRAMEKDRQRRYPSAAELAADIERFLTNQPVLARPPSVAYLTARWIQRNRTLFIAACFCLLAMVTGTVVALWQAQLAFVAKQNAEMQKSLAEQQKQRAEEEAARAVSAELLAKKESARQQEAASFLTTLLDEVADQVGKGRNPEALRLGLLETQPMLYEIKDDPILRAELLSRTAKLWDSMGERKHAIPMLQTRAELLSEIHGPLSPEARAARMEHIRIVGDHGVRSEAMPLLLQLREELEAKDERGTRFWFEVQREIVRLLTKMDSTAEAVKASEIMMKQAKAAKLKGKHLYHCLMAYQWALQSHREYDASEALLYQCRALALTERDRVTMERDINRKLSVLLREKGDYLKGAEHQKQVLTLMRQELGQVHVALVEPLVLLSDFETKAGLHEDAVGHAREALTQASETQKGVATQLALTLREEKVTAMIQLTNALSAAKIHDESVKQALEAIEVAKLTGNKELIYESLRVTAAAYRAAGNLAEAYQYMDLSVKNREQRDLNYRARWDDKRELTMICYEQRRYAEALRIATENWHQNLADPAACKDATHMGYCAQLALHCWQAVHDQEPTLKEPAELSAWLAASLKDGAAEK